MALPMPARPRPIPLTREEFVIATKGNYSPVVLIGAGKDGEVWHAHHLTNPAESEGSHSDLINPIHETQSGSQEVEVCAVKVCRYNSYAFTNEVKTIQHIQTQTQGSPLSSLFIQVLDFREELPNPWFAMKAIQGVDLGSFRTAAPGPIPESLTAHIAIQLHDAVRWLHELTRPVSHNDLYENNIMLDSSGPDVHGLPNVVIIDFGNAKIGATQGPMSRERRALYWNIARLALHRQPCIATHTTGADNAKAESKCTHDGAWTEFIKTMCNPESFCYPGEGIRHVEFRPRFYEKLTWRRDEISMESKKVVNALMDRAKHRADVIANGHAQSWDGIGRRL